MRSSNGSCQWKLVKGSLHGPASLHGSQCPNHVRTSPPTPRTLVPLPLPAGKLQTGEPAKRSCAAGGARRAAPRRCPWWFVCCRTGARGGGGGGGGGGVSGSSQEAGEGKWKQKVGLTYDYTMQQCNTATSASAGQR